MDKPASSKTYYIIPNLFGLLMGASLGNERTQNFDQSDSKIQTSNQARFS